MIFITLERKNVNDNDDDGVGDVHIILNVHF